MHEQHYDHRHSVQSWRRPHPCTFCAAALFAVLLLLVVVALVVFLAFGDRLRVGDTSNVNKTARALSADFVSASSLFQLL